MLALGTNDAALEDPWKRNKLENISLLLKAAIEAQGRVGVSGLSGATVDGSPAGIDAATVNIAALKGRQRFTNCCAILTLSCCGS